MAPFLDNTTLATRNGLVLNHEFPAAGEGGRGPHRREHRRSRQVDEHGYVCRIDTEWLWLQIPTRTLNTIHSRALRYLLGSQIGEVPAG